jgi:glucose-1-phosphate thymidylyltransferase
MIYYPLSTVMMAGIRDVLVITSPEFRAAFEALLGDGRRVACASRTPPSPRRRYRASVLDRRGLHRQGPVALILGDNIFFGHGLPEALAAAARREAGATVFAYSVRDPQRYGVVEFDGAGRAVSIEEKPARPKSSYAITGCTSSMPTSSTSRAGSGRRRAGELEITDVNRAYLARGNLKVEVPRPRHRVAR